MEAAGEPANDTQADQKPSLVLWGALPTTLSM